MFCLVQPQLGFYVLITVCYLHIKQRHTPAEGAFGSVRSSQQFFARSALSQSIGVNLVSQVSHMFCLVQPQLDSYSKVPWLVPLLVLDPKIHESIFSLSPKVHKKKLSCSLNS
ncbi:Putative aconitate hydratase [Frankliniella fusca]|uniref:Aconitate hydratase n=1 Tax=Frankliniella fusca TaxID=407009 RepID=A0AAE1HQ80_9NEOP|nr:Putative aconitate hydratase [Frankliniella fusca]